MTLNPAGIAVAGGHVYLADPFHNVVREVDGTGSDTVIAGDGTSGYSGDAGRAMAAELDSPSGVAVDGSGNVVIADTGNARLRVVAASTGTFYGVSMTAGDIYTVAGDGTGGYSGDERPATAAELNEPTGVAVDGSGNVVIADTGNARLRVVAESTGTFYGVPMTAADIYTVAGGKPAHSSVKGTSTTTCPAGTTRTAGSTCTASAAALSYDGPIQLVASSNFSPNVTVTSSSAICTAGQAVSFSLSVDPLTGASGPYDLGTGTASASSAEGTGPILDTTGWQSGVYTLTASAGTHNVGAVVCPAAVTTASLSVAAPGQSALAFGTFDPAGGGQATMAFSATVMAPGDYIGEVDITSTDQWMLVGDLSSYTTTGTQGVLQGTGTLFWWDPTANDSQGAWSPAKIGITYQITVTPTTSSAPGTLGLSFDGAPASPPSTPTPDTVPVPLTSGLISLS